MINSSLCRPQNKPPVVDQLAVIVVISNYRLNTLNKSLDVLFTDDFPKLNFVL